MVIKIPEKFMGKLVKGSIERSLANASTPEPEKPENKKIIVPQPVEGFIYVPSISLYVGREKLFHGSNLNKAHEKLQAQDSRMLTPYQFMEFIKYLQNNSIPDKDKILDEILTVREPYRSEWLDAKFSEQGKDMFIEHFGQKPAKLEKCVAREGWVDMNSYNSQGMPTKTIKKHELYFYPPTADTVAGFSADSNGASLDCDRDPTNSYTSLGVRPAREKI
ncbi:MAG: hypothetical protein Q8L29_03635 [archaeon]|nr:hypothetical protein [archaeon]